MINCGAALAADDEAVTGSGARLEASSSTGAGSVKGAALARMSFGSAESCDPRQTTELEAFDQRVGVGRGGLGETCKGRNADHGQHDRRGNAPGDEHARLALTPAEVVNERLHMRLRGRLRFERQARLKGLRVAEIVAAAGLGADCERKVLKKGAELLVVRHQASAVEPRASGEVSCRGRCASCIAASRYTERCCGGLRPSAPRELPPDDPLRGTRGAAVDATVANQALLCRARRNRSYLYSMVTPPNGLAARRYAPRLPPPTKKAR